MEAMLANKIFLNCCPTGMVPTKQMNPHVPLSIHEIIQEAIQLYRLGVSILHLHARDETGKPTWRKSVYQRIIAGIREVCPDVIICVTTSGRDWQDFTRRSEVLEITGDEKPDMASLTLGSLNFMHSASCNAPQMIEDLAKKMLDHDIKPEVEIFNPGMINQLQILIKKQLVQAPYYTNLIFGNIFTMQPDLALIAYCLERIPKPNVVALAGIGRFQFAVNQIALAINQGVRIGLEDNLYFDEEKNLATNLSLVKRLREICQISGKKIANAQEMRSLLNLKSLTLPSKLIEA